MVALVVDIKDGVIFFHVWLIMPSFQIQSDVKKIYDLLIDSNKLQGEAIFPEDFLKFLPGSLCASGCLGGYCKPVIFVSSNVDV